MTRIKLLARDVMTTDVRTVSHDSSLAEAVAILDREGFEQLPVMRGDEVVALLTEADVRRALMQNRRDRPVIELAGRLPELVEPDTRISHTLQAMDDQHAILVVDQGKLVGIITYWDMMMLGRPHVMVKEVEQLLRIIVQVSCERQFGHEWWERLPQNLRERAEEEHEMWDKHAKADSVHMLGHTTFYGLVKIFEHIRPDVSERHRKELDEIRIFRNEISHLTPLSPEEQADMSRRCLAISDWLAGQIPDSEL